ncbi:MAG TPA: MBOAT family protein, partial [Bacteroidia bacterium]|nr:MBOAT family protein [Bacteroidia bacterium]
MLFNSFAFVCLVLVTFCLYYFPKVSRFQVHILILSSLFFYAFNNPALLLLLLTSASINILTSYYVVYGKVDRRKLLATLGVIANLSILLFFKYGPLFSKTLFDTKGSIGNFLLTIPLPIGISFYTFEGISLLVDVYRKNHEEAVDIVIPSLPQHARRTLLFISFFPHLIAGP